ncbi:DUF1697 domain-containing protein [Cellulomonas composti]|uniref:DUF1697 domain-containing protein n=1 Tax=Cellulomonas composti TaxID=266130 RepID=A0A511JB59_9CELL|nr:DUF1697 domain-containing protein [Cellulomonas composti]GEL95231.1 hypothetical protein CCO02nite_18890 [Cellulomonas composti]
MGTGTQVVIGLLRAVNVGGARKLTSAQLRATAQSLGYGDVTTYVNSGNVVLTAPDGGAQAAARVADDLGVALSAEVSFTVHVITRTAAQWHAAVAAMPFPDEARDDPAHVVLVAWDGPAAAGAAIDPSRYGRERLHWDGSELYTYYPDGIGTSKLTLPVLEKAAGRVGTARNWRTVLALDALASERE